MFAYTIDATDIATGWTEQRAVWGKGEKATLEQIKHRFSQNPQPPHFLPKLSCPNNLY
jgi:hypothetical protein